MLAKAIVLLPYRFTLFSNAVYIALTIFEFYYLIDLHYSQTVSVTDANGNLFYYLIDLHYSQTDISLEAATYRFYYLIDLHYSQTH